MTGITSRTAREQRSYGFYNAQSFYVRAIASMFEGKSGELTRYLPSSDASNSSSKNSRFTNLIGDFSIAAHADKPVGGGCKRWRSRGCCGSYAAGWPSGPPSPSFSRQKKDRCKPIYIYPRVSPKIKCRENTTVRLISRCRSLIKALNSGGCSPKCLLEGGL